MRRTLALAVSLMFCQTALAASPDLKGISLGMSDADFIGVAKNYHCDNQVPDWCSFPETIGGAVGVFFVSFVDGEIVSIRVSEIDPSLFSNVSAALSKKFGAPARSRSAVQNAMGARFDQETLHWIRKDWQMVAEKRDSDDLFKSYIFLVSNAYAKRLNDEARKNVDDS